MSIRPLNRPTAAPICAAAAVGLAAIGEGQGVDLVLAAIGGAPVGLFALVIRIGLHGCDLSLVGPPGTAPRAAK